MTAVAIAAAFFAGSVVAMAVAGDGAQTAKKKKKVKRGPAGPAGAQGATGAPGSNTTNVVPIDYFASGGTATVTPIFSANGFTLNASCPGAVDGLYASTGSGALYVKWTTFASSADAGNNSTGESDSYTKAEDDANIADLFVGDDLVADGTMIYDTNGSGVPGGKPISIVFHGEETAGGCAFTGTATISS
jgi:hypothetical protein